MIPVLEFFNVPPPSQGGEWMKLMASRFLLIQFCCREILNKVRIKWYLKTPKIIL